MADDHPDYAFLERRHIQDLTDAVRALTTILARDAESRKGDDKLRRAHEARQSAALDLIAKYTANLPALMDALVTKHTNGHGHHDEGDSDERPHTR